MAVDGKDLLILTASVSLCVMSMHLGSNNNILTLYSFIIMIENRCAGMIKTSMVLH